MELLLMIISAVLIVLVLLQSSKAEGGNALSGGNDSLFANRKERGGELFITRLTFLLGMSFLALSIMIKILN